MSKGHWLLVISLVLLLSFAYCSGNANAQDKFPLIWQASSVENADGSVIKRLHDPEAGVNCYVIRSPEYISFGHSRPISISCVKVK